MTAKIMTLALAALVLSALASTADATIASPWPFSIDQDNGNTGTLYIRGTPDDHWTEDAKGYTVCPGRGKYYYCKATSDGDVAPSNFQVGRDDPGKAGLKPGMQRSAEKKMEKCGDFCEYGLTGRWNKPDKMKPNKINPDNGAGSNAGRSLLRGRGDALPAPRPLGRGDARRLLQGTLKNLVVLMIFSDHVTRDNRPTEAQVDTLMNAESPVPDICPTGGVRKVFLDSSHGNLVVESTVHAWVTVPQTEAYCAGDRNGISTKMTQHAIASALDAIDAEGFDFTAFDQDDDGEIDAITFLHSGYGAEWGGDDSYGGLFEDRIWSHASSLYFLPEQKWTSWDGVDVREYHISPAIWATSGSDIGHIGVIAHEMGHTLSSPSLPDLKIGCYSLMANSWGIDGSQHYPPTMDLWSKAQLGWASITTLTAYQTGLSLPSHQHFMIQTGYADREYLLIENRRNIGFDALLPQSGIIIYHIDELAGNTAGYPHQTGWPENGNHYRVAILQADGDYDLEKRNNFGDAGDVFHACGTNSIGPGYNTNYPNTDSYQGGTIVSTFHLIENISSPGETMTFDFVCATDAACDDGVEVTADTCGADGLCSNTCPVETEEIIYVDILTDRWPGETTWTIVNDCTGQTQASGGPYGSRSTLERFGDCVPSAQYTFTINDSAGDGICCSYGLGEYNIIYKGLIVASGGSFGSSESTTFGSC